MAYSPIAFIAPNYRDYGTYWLKAYIPGATTPKIIATDSAGATTVAKLQLNVDGFFVSAGGALVIPFVDGNYDAYLFKTAALADANDTTGAIRLADNIDPFNLIDDLSQASEFTTFSNAINFAGLIAGKVIHIKNRNGVSSTWDAVLASSVTPNTNGIVISVGSPTIAIVLRNKDINTEESIASVIQTTNGFNDIDPAYMSELKALGDISSDSDSVTVARKSIKAWKRPSGIKDSAVAASFGLNNGVSEPNTQVSGFPTIDQIGIQQSRDAVVLFGQVDSAPPLLVTSSTTYTATTIVSPDFAAIWDQIEIGLIADVNFGTTGWVGAVVTSKSGTDTLNIQSWRNIDGVSGLATTPTNGQPLTIDRHNAIWGANFNAIIPAANSGANQAIGIEVGLSCTKAGTGANSKGYFAVNLGGERPEFAYTMTGPWSKGYTSQNANIYGFSSIGDGIGLSVLNSTGNALQTQDPTGHHIECRDTTSSAQFIVKNDGKVLLGKNAESGTARLNLRGAGDFTTAYNQTEIAIFDPTTALVDRQGFFISQQYPASSGAGSFKMGVGNSSNHTYQFTMNTQGVDRMTFHSSGDIHAGVDATQSLGVASLKWEDLVLLNAPTVTSDERLKTFGNGFVDAEKRVAIALKALVTSYKWNTSIIRENEGGNKARIHIGLGAQSLAQAFRDEGLDPGEYSMFHYDEWEDILETVQTNKGSVTITPTETEVQKTVKTIVDVKSESVKLINGNYTLVKKITPTEVDQPVYNIHPVYNGQGVQIMERVTNKGDDGKEVISNVPKTISIPVMESTTIDVETEDTPIYEEVVKVKAGNVFGIKLEEVTLFIIANT